MIIKLGHVSEVAVALPYQSIGSYPHPREGYIQHLHNIYYTEQQFNLIFFTLITKKMPCKSVSTNEPHDKTNKITVRPAKTQISLGIRPFGSESSLSTQLVSKDPSFLHADSEDSERLG